MLIYRTARHGKKRVLKLTHAVLHFVAFIFTVIALKAAFDSHNYASPPKPNLYTLHSWIGLITVILFSYQVSWLIVQKCFNYLLNDFSFFLDLLHSSSLDSRER